MRFPARTRRWERGNRDRNLPFRLPQPEHLQPPARDEVEALGAATGHLDALLETDLARFKDLFQQSRLGAGPGHVLGAQAIASILPALGMEEIIRAVLAIPPPEARAIDAAETMLRIRGEEADFIISVKAVFRYRHPTKRKRLKTIIQELILVPATDFPHIPKSFVPN